MSHFIRQQFLNIDLNGSEAEGFALQRHMPDLYYSKVLPAIGEVLDDYDASGTQLVIDRLVIDAGTISLSRIDQDLASIVAAELRKMIKKEAVKSVLNDDDQQINMGATFIQRIEEKLWDVFIYFLKVGRLPWSYQLPEGKSLEVVLSELLVHNDSGTDIPIPVVKIMESFHSPGVAKRLILQFSMHFIQLLFRKVAPGILTVYHELVKLIDASEHLHNKADLQSNLPYSFVFTPEIRDLVNQLILEKTIILSSFNPVVPKVEIVNQVLDELKPQTGLVKYLMRIFEDILSRDQPLINKSHLKKLDETAEVTGKIQSVSVSAIGSESVNQEIREGIFIDNAGLVLLHPFLQRFFEQLGIAKEDELLQSERALCLLHYLVTGFTEAPEYELVLPKLLCGIPLSMPVPLLFDISESEKNEASAMLEAVISHWEALGNTSVDGLRGSFLVRPGKLSQKEDGDWLLQVESRTYDILLDQLPWGISMIRLPWMKTMLWVEWR
jgi:hypothetical protein